MSSILCLVYLGYRYSKLALEPEEPGEFSDNLALDPEEPEELPDNLALDPEEP